MPAIRPHVLTIGTTGSAEILRARGCTVSQVATLLGGYRQAVRRLDRAAPIRPTIILLDLHAAEPGFPELAAPQLVAVLAHAMQAGSIHPAWLIGLAPAGTPALDAEARVAGCHHLLRPPLDAAALAVLGDRTLPPAPVPQIDASSAVAPAIHAYRQAAARVLHAVEAAQIREWTVEDARLLLHVLTPYPLKEQRGISARTSEVLRALGGMRLARARLEAIAACWQTRFPLHGAILRLFPDGLERAQIVRHFVERGLYEDSRVYHCITELPERLAQELRIRQAHEEGDL